ncbi:hypothetical protein B0H10DRAFT_2126203 [Mycena sp. CBHHK59/15]|nr:hypothetical protein B0H10DRAFT_2126203 [Mycena sp. CBHHK59/15]
MRIALEFRKLETSCRFMCSARCRLKPWPKLCRVRAHVPSSRFTLSSQPNQSQTSCHTLNIHLPPTAEARNILLSIMNIIQDVFPPEILQDIFKYASFHGAIDISQVCHRWRAVAAGTQDLWVRMRVRSRDIAHRDVVSSFFERSKQEIISLKLDFKEPQPREEEFFWMLVEVVKPHMARCYAMCITADFIEWRAVILAFRGEKFRKLRVLDADNAAPLSVAHIIFPLPRSGVQCLRLQGVALGDARHPRLKRLRIDRRFPPSLAPDWQLDRWMLDTPTELILENFCIPHVVSPSTEEPASHIERLVLRQLIAPLLDAPDEDGNTEHNCAPFFEWLLPKNVRYLEIDYLDPVGRVWADFIVTLQKDERTYPCVVELKLRGMHFSGFSYDNLGFVIDSFPALERMELVDCYEGTWENMIEMLELYPETCPALRSLLVDEDEDGDGPTVVLRDDPLPFRAGMYDVEFHWAFSLIF